MSWRTFWSERQKLVLDDGSQEGVCRKNFSFLFQFHVLVLFLIVLYGLIFKNFPISGFLVLCRSSGTDSFQVQSSEDTALIHLIGSLMLDI